MEVSFIVGDIWGILWLKYYWPDKKLLSQLAVSEEKI